jgi:hypothetical protein
MGLATWQAAVEDGVDSIERKSWGEVGPYLD